MHGRSVFYKNAAGDVFHTYSSFGRGGEMHLGTYHYLDITPKGREETINGNMTDWVRHHNKFRRRWLCQLHRAVHGPRGRGRLLPYGNVSCRMVPRRSSKSHFNLAPLLDRYGLALVRPSAPRRRCEDGQIKSAHDGDGCMLGQSIARGFAPDLPLSERAGSAQCLDLCWRQIEHVRQNHFGIGAKTVKAPKAPKAPTDLLLGLLPPRSIPGFLPVRSPRLQTIG